MTVGIEQQPSSPDGADIRSEELDRIVDEIVETRGSGPTAAYVTSHMVRAAVADALNRGIEIGRNNGKSTQSPNGQGEIE